MKMPPEHLDLRIMRRPPEDLTKILVWVDEVPQRLVLAYHVAEGWVVRYRTGPDGRLMMTEDKRASLTETVRGTVRVAYMEERREIIAVLRELRQPGCSATQTAMAKEIVALRHQLRNSVPGI